MKTEFPLKFTTEYRTSLSKDELIGQLNTGESEKILRGLTTKKYSKEIKSNQFLIQRYIIGLDLDLIMGNPPLIIGTFDNNYQQKIKVEFIPYLLNAIFFILFSLVFMIGSLTMEKATINGVVKEADFGIKSMFFGVGLFVLLLWYWLDIRPIRHSKKWLESKLKLTEL